MYRDCSFLWAGSFLKPLSECAEYRRYAGAAKIRLVDGDAFM